MIPETGVHSLTWYRVRELSVNYCVVLGRVRKESGSTHLFFKHSTPTLKQISMIIFSNCSLKCQSLFNQPRFRNEASTTTPKPSIRETNNKMYRYIRDISSSYSNNLGNRTSISLPGWRLPLGVGVFPVPLMWLIG